MASAVRATITSIPAEPEREDLPVLAGLAGGTLRFVQPEARRFGTGTVSRAERWQDGGNVLPRVEPGGGI
jgi:hypothetical protein